MGRTFMMQRVLRAPAFWIALAAVAAVLVIVVMMAGGGGGGGGGVGY
jgi:preprotein translocase subunit SecG